MGVSVLIPTRGRPDRFRKAAESCMKTKKGKLEIVAYLDEDDKDIRKYEDLCLDGVRYVIGPRMGLARIIHRLIDLSMYSYIFLGADDIEFITPGWDVEMVEKMPEDCIGVVYCQDNWKQTLNHFMFHQKFVSLTGLFPDDFEHFGPDGYVAKVVDPLNRRIFLKDVVIEHHHFKNNKAKPDPTYLEARDGGITDRDIKRLKDYQPQIERDIAVLREYI